MEKKIKKLPKFMNLIKEIAFNARIQKMNTRVLFTDMGGVISLKSDSYNKTYKPVIGADFPPLITGFSALCLN